MEIEKLVVYGFDRERKCEIAADLSLYLREASHGADGH
jgi:hypothetical protein